MTNKNDNAFLRSIRGVKPINRSNKIKKNIQPSSIKKITKTNNDNIRQEKISNHIDLPKITKSEFNLQKSSINKKIKKREIQIDKKIDFHGMSLFDSEILFSETIKNCFQKNLRCILFITGKGIFNKDSTDNKKPKLYYGKIRNNFTKWIKKKELERFILSFEQANMKHGADGAFFVYLRRKKF